MLHPSKNETQIVEIVKNTTNEMLPILEKKECRDIGNRRRISEEIKLEIIKKYLTGKYTLVKLTKEYNINDRTISKILKKNKIKVINTPEIYAQKYTINKDYFNEIDTKEKAYFLGFLYADGYNNEKKGMVKITLNNKDHDLLVKFNELLQHNKPIYVESITHLSGNKSLMSSLLITNKNISKQLKKYGMFQAKSLSLKFPKFLLKDINLLKSFILGYFDGDGSICKSNMGKYKSFIVRITSSKYFCYYLRRVLNKLLNINFIIYKRKTKSDKTFEISLRGNKQIYKFMKWLYEDESIKLERKYNKFLELENKVLNNTITLKERNLTKSGITKTLSEWSKILKIDYKTLHYRITHGWSDQEIINTPVNSYKKNENKTANN